MGRKANDGGTVVQWWHGLAVPTFWFGTVGVLGEVLGLILWVFVFGMCLGNGSLAKRVA